MCECAGHWRRLRRRREGRFRSNASKFAGGIPMRLMTRMMHAENRPMSKGRDIPIRTTVVGSYPVPDWLVSAPSQQALIDATRVVFKIQEMAGIDVVADGELYRFDINHPDTNGMIEYFIRPMSGIRSNLGRAELAEFRKMAGMQFRSEPAGLVESAIGEGTLNLPRDYRRARELPDHTLKFTL